MDKIGFLCVSLGSSTFQLHDSLGSRHACTCSEAGFGSQNGNHTAEKLRSVVRFLQVEGLSAKDFHEENVPVYNGKCL
jgi:hypothetical protein